MDDRRYLGVDLGTKRIGFAISGPGGMASALKVVPAGGQPDADARLIARFVEEYGPDAVVIGLPLNMDDTEGPQARACRVVAAALTARCPGLEVVLHDERLTSHAADGHLAQRDFTRRQKKARQDAVAAQVLLESFLAGRKESP